MNTADLICSCINRFSQGGGHPYATRQNLQFFRTDHAYLCVVEARLSGQANADTQAILDRLTKEDVAKLTKED